MLGGGKFENGKLRFGWVFRPDLAYIFFFTRWMGVWIYRLDNILKLDHSGVELLAGLFQPYRSMVMALCLIKLFGFKPRKFREIHPFVFLFRPVGASTIPAA